MSQRHVNRSEGEKQKLIYKTTKHELYEKPTKADDYIQQIGI